MEIVTCPGGKDGGVRGGAGMDEGAGNGIMPARRRHVQFSSAVVAVRSSSFCSSSSSNL